MAQIAVIVTPPGYVASLGAMVDAHARLGEVFATNAALSDYARMETALRIAPASGGAIELVGGRRFPADCQLDELTDLRLIYLPSFQLPDPDALAEVLTRFSALHTWLRDRASEGIAIGACGASAFHLAAAGLLEAQPCAVPPRLMGAMRRLFPRVETDVDAAIRRAGNLWTCSRDADNAALVARLFAEGFSLTLGRSIAMREPPGEAAGPLAAPIDPLVARAQLWVRERFTRQFRIADLARDLGVSHQSLIRRFRDAGSASPRAFVQRTRIDAAAAMLAETSRSVTEIAQLVGYADVPSFRQVFVRLTGVTPGDWRKRHRMARRRLTSGAEIRL